MLFKILNEDEKSLLNEEELIRYDEQLKIYNERVAFVEKLEKQENVEIKPYKPVLRRIGTVKKISEKFFDKPEKRKIIIEKKISDPKIGFLNKINSITTFNPSSVTVREISNRNRLNEFVRKQKENNITFQKPEMPDISRKITVNEVPQIKKFTGCKVDIKNIPQTKVYKVSDNSFKKPEMPDLSLNTDYGTEVLINSFKKKKYKPENINNNSVNTSVAVKKFVRPELQKPEINTKISSVPKLKKCEIKKYQVIGMPEIKSYTDIKGSIFKKPEIKKYQVTGMPEKTSYTDIKGRIFKKPEINADIPDIRCRTDVKVIDYSSNSYSASGIPVMNKKEIKARKFDKPQISVKQNLSNDIKSDVKISVDFRKPQRKNISFNIEIKKINKTEFIKPEIEITDIDNIEIKAADSALSKIKHITKDYEEN